MRVVRVDGVLLGQVERAGRRLWSGSSYAAGPIDGLFGTYAAARNAVIHAGRRDSRVNRDTPSPFPYLQEQHTR